VTPRYHTVKSRSLYLSISLSPGPGSVPGRYGHQYRQTDRQTALR